MIDFDTVYVYSEMEFCLHVRAGGLGTTNTGHERLELGAPINLEVGLPLVNCLACRAWNMFESVVR